jgi:hypothetical protein
MTELVNKLKILKNPRKKSARDLLKSITKPGYNVSITNKKDVVVRIDKKDVSMSLNSRKFTNP